MANQKKADVAPAVAPAEALTEEQRRERERQERTIKPVVAPPPAPGQSVADQESAARAKNPQADLGQWLGKKTSAWFTDAAADTKAAALGDIAQAIIARFTADTALAAGHAVTSEWISGQILTYQLPITEDDVRQATTAAFGEAGIQVQG